MGRLALIGSYGIMGAEMLRDVESLTTTTAAGSVSAHTGQLGSSKIIYLTRSNGRPGVSPHLVNYRANALALHEWGVTHVFATAVAGSLTVDIRPNTLVLLDQFLDFTKRRDGSIFDSNGFALVDMTDPYCPNLRNAILNAAQVLSIPIRPTGCYVGLEGPRFETRAEVQMYRQLGGDVVGHTNIPEVVMARETGMCYSAIAVVTNLGAGLASHQIARRDIHQATLEEAPTLTSLLYKTIESFVPNDSCNCKFGPADFVSA